MIIATVDDMRAKQILVRGSVLLRIFGEKQEAVPPSGESLQDNKKVGLKD